MKRIEAYMKFLVLSLLMGLAAGGCSRADECVPERQEFCLKPVSAAQTKAAALLDKTIGVLGNFVPVAPGALNDESRGKSLYWQKSQLFIDNACFARFGDLYAGADPADPSRRVPYYWPQTGSLMFTVYAPHSSQAREIRSVDLMKHSMSNMQDYMKIDVLLLDGSEKNFDLLFVDSNNINRGRTLGRQTAAVPLLMRHAQAKVSFRVKNPDAQYKVTAVLRNCVRSASFYSGDVPGWLPHFSDKANLLTDFEIFRDQPLGPTAVESSVTLIPMQLDGTYPNTEAKLTPVVLEVDIACKDGIGGYRIKVPMTRYSEDWSVGKHYIYNMTVNSQQIVFDDPIIENIENHTNL